MAFYNASELPGEFYKQTVGNLCGSTTYQFAAWIANALNPAVDVGVNPDISFLIEQTDGTVLAVYDTGPIGQNSVFTWLQYGFDFTTPPNVTSVILKMINNSHGGLDHVGNDLAIDDITFRPCGPESKASFSTTAAVDSIALCAGTDTVIYGSVSNEYGSPGYLWQMSTDSGASWTDIPNANQLQIAIAPPRTGVTVTYQYRLLAAENANINSPNCRVVSNLVYLTSVVVSVPEFSFDEDVCNPLQVDFASTALPGVTYDWLIGGIALHRRPKPHCAISVNMGLIPVEIKGDRERMYAGIASRKYFGSLVQPGEIITMPVTRRSVPAKAFVCRP